MTSGNLTGEVALIGPDPDLCRRSQSFSRFLSGVLVALGGAVLLGWGLEIPVLMSVLPHSVVMKANTALGLLLGGAAMWFLNAPFPTRWTLLAARLCGGLVLLLGAVTLLEYLTGVHFGFGQLLFLDATRTAYPGRMAPASALLFLLLGSSALLLSFSSRIEPGEPSESVSAPRQNRTSGRGGVLSAQILSLLALLVSCFIILQYLFHAETLFALSHYTHVALHTAIGFLAFSVALLSSRPDQGITALATSSSQGGQMLRRLLLPTFMIPAVIGWIRLKGQELGLYDTEYGITVSAFTTVLLLGALIWLSARSIDKVERNRRLMEIKLRHTNTLFDAVAEGTTDPIYVKSHEGNYLMINTAGALLMETTPDQVLGKSDLDFFPPETARCLQANDREIIASGITQTREEQLSVGGVLRTYHSIKGPLFDSAGKVAGLVGISRDITERKAAQEALRIGQERFEMAARATHDVIYEWTVATGYLWWNESMALHFGYGGEEEYHNIGWWTAHIHPDDIERVEASLHEVMEQRNTSWSAEYRFRLADGDYAEILDRGYVLYDAAGKPQRMLGSMMNITERKRSSEALARKSADLARSNADLEQFAYVASHDLQEPLRMITSYLQLLERRYREKLDDDAREFIDYAVDGAKRMQVLIRDLLAYSRVARGSEPLARVDMGCVFDQAVENLRISLDEQGATVTRDSLPVVAGDSGQLVQLFQNLIGNAVKFRAPDRPPIVHLSARKGADDTWTFSVQDNGIGIEPQYAERIFVIFQRLHSRADYPGTGIGLAICKKVVERNDGRIWVDSVPGEGTTFHFTLRPTGRVG